MGKPFDFMVHKLCKQILSKVTALPDTIAAVKTAVADMAKYVATNNTASKTGILSQKITYLINQNEAHGSVERTTAGSQNWACPAGVYQVLVIATGGSGGGGGGGGKAISSKVWTNWKGAGGVWHRCGLSDSPVCEGLHVAARTEPGHDSFGKLHQFARAQSECYWYFGKRKHPRTGSIEQVKP